MKLDSKVLYSKQELQNCTMKELKEFACEMGCSAYTDATRKESWVNSINKFQQQYGQIERIDAVNSVNRIIVSTFERVVSVIKLDSKQVDVKVEHVVTGKQRAFVTTQQLTVLCYEPGFFTGVKTEIGTIRLGTQLWSPQSASILTVEKIVDLNNGFIYLWLSAYEGSSNSKVSLEVVENLYELYQGQDQDTTSYDYAYLNYMGQRVHASLSLRYSERSVTVELGGLRVTATQRRQNGGWSPARAEAKGDRITDFGLATRLMRVLECMVADMESPRYSSNASIYRRFQAAKRLYK